MTSETSVSCPRSGHPEICPARAGALDSPLTTLAGGRRTSDFDRYRPSASSSRAANAPISPATPKVEQADRARVRPRGRDETRRDQDEQAVDQGPDHDEGRAEKKELRRCRSVAGIDELREEGYEEQDDFRICDVDENAGHIGLGQARRGAIARLQPQRAPWRKAPWPATGDRTPLRFAARRKGARRRRSARKGRRPRRKYGRGRRSSRPRGLRNRASAHRSGSCPETGPCQGRASLRAERRRRNRRGAAGRRGGRTTRGTPQTRM